jgi:hypothetical protein
MKFLALLLIASVPAQFTGKSTYIDKIEKNSVYTEQGGYIYSQVILWERDPVTGKYEVREWYLLDREDDPRHPVRQTNGLVEALLEQNNPYTKVRSRLYVETHTPYDRERANQKFLQVEDRIVVPREMVKK